MKDVFMSLYQTLRSGGDGVLVTVLSSSGSTPRKSGSNMLITAKGQTGTIGGGTIEYQSALLAGELLLQKRSLVKKYCLSSADRDNLGMICGGDMEVAFYYCGSQDMVIFEEMADFFANDRECYLELNISAAQIQMQFRLGQAPTSGAKYKAAAGGGIYTQPLIEKGTIYIFGGGHIAGQLSEILEKLAFRWQVLDNEPAFLAAFAEDRCQVIDFERIQENITFLPQDYVIIITRGHQYDKQVLAQVISIDLTYIGMIGSRQKIKATYEKLTAENPTIKERLPLVHAPIGLSIGAQTPEEIAVAIAAELIQVRYEKRHENAV